MKGFLSMTVARCCSRRSSCPRLSCYTCCRARGSDTKGAVTAQGFLCTLRIHGVFLVTRAARMGKNRLETAPHPSDQIFPEDQTLFEMRNPCVFVKRSVQKKKNQQHSSANYKLLGSAWQNSSTFTVARWPLLSLAAGRWSTTFSKGECACVTPTCGFKSHFATVTQNSGVSSATCVTLGALRNVLWMWEGAKTAAYWTRERTVTQRHRPFLARQVFNSHRNRESRLKGRAHVENRVIYARQMRTWMPGNLLLWLH